MAKTSATGPIRESPRSDVPQQVQPDLAAASTATPTSPKRGRGRPPKAKSDSNENGSVRRVSARPKKDVASDVATTSTAPAVKSTRTRPKRSNPPPAAASQVTASRKRGRPKKDDVAAATVPGTKRGRKSKVQVAAVNSARRTTRKSYSVAPVAANVGDLKKKTTLLQKKVKEAAAKLKIAVTAIEAVEAIAAGM